MNDGGLARGLARARRRYRARIHARRARAAARAWIAIICLGSRAVLFASSNSTRISRFRWESSPAPRTQSAWLLNLSDSGWPGRMAGPGFMIRGSEKGLPVAPQGESCCYAQSKALHTAANTPPTSWLIKNVKITHVLFSNKNTPTNTPIARVGLTPSRAAPT